MVVCCRLVTTVALVLSAYELHHIVVYCKLGKMHYAPNFGYDNLVTMSSHGNWAAVIGLF